MKELLIVSGKGGAGKTTAAACFAKLASGRAVLADCDVDGSNLPLLLAPQELERHDFMAGAFPELDDELCTRCGKCAEVCRFGAVDLSGNKPEFGRSCEGCGACSDQCPAGAISMKERLCGHWSCSATSAGLLYHAELLPGGENSGKLVAELRQNARAAAEKKALPLLICDGPPGIGCPVISASTGADFALVVTEPTLSGIHDMKRLAVLLRQFEVPFALVINKCDLNAEKSREIAGWCRENDLPLLGEIPFDPLFPRALRELKTVLDFPESASGKIIKNIWSELIKIMQVEGV